jgi:hypothetical protein
MPLKTSDEKQDLILKVFDYFEAESMIFRKIVPVVIIYDPVLLRFLPKSCPLGLYVKYLYHMWICAEGVSS